MPRVAIGQFAPTIGHTSSTYIADADSFEDTLETVFAIYETAFIKNGTYILSDTYAIPSGKTILGQPGLRPTLQMTAGTNKTVITNANASSGGITTGVTMKSLVIDQQGDLQAGGGGIVVNGIQSWELDEIIIKKSYRFNFLALHQSTGVANNTGTVTFTQGSATVSGSGTLFTTELAVGDILKSSGNNFGRIESIETASSLTLTQAWGPSTEVGVTFKTIEPNSGNYFSRIRYEGTVDNADASGYGLFDNSTVEYSEALGADGGGCGFVPDHARNMQLNHLSSHDNNNSGISLESSEDCTIRYPVTHSNVGGNGVQFISGTSRCEVQDGKASGNVNGFTISYNSVVHPIPTGNIFTRCVGNLNSGYAFRNDGGDETEYDTVTGFNNDTGGIIVNTATHVPDAVHIHHSDFYDDRGGAKSQDRGIWIVAGTDTLVNDNTALDSLHVISGIVDTGTNTTLTNNTT